MIEDYDSRSSRLAFDQLFDLRVINGLQLVLIEKIHDLRLVLDKDKALLVQRKPLVERPAVEQRHRFKLHRSRPSSVNVLRTEGFVDENFTVVNCVWDFNGNCFRHKRGSFLFFRRITQRLHYQLTTLSGPCKCCAYGAPKSRTEL